MKNKVEFRQCAYKWGAECQKLHAMFASNNAVDARGKEYVATDLSDASEKKYCVKGSYNSKFRNR